MEQQDPNDDRRGFALVVVLYGLAFVSLFAVTIIVSGKYRIEAGARQVESQRVDALVDAAINLRILKITDLLATPAATESRSEEIRQPVSCLMPDRSIAISVVEDEAGKVDINTASPELLIALLRGVGVKPEQAELLAQDIRKFSAPTETGEAPGDRPKGADNDNLPPKFASFDTVFELDQVVGVDSEMLRALIPHVTVHSRLAGIDVGKASPEFLALLTGRSITRERGSNMSDGNNSSWHDAIPSQFHTPAQNHTMLVHAEVYSRSGARISRERLIEVPASRRTLRFLERRQGSLEYESLATRLLEENPSAQLPKCRSR